jgi:hypothetical protein
MVPSTCAGGPTDGGGGGGDDGGDDGGFLGSDGFGDPFAGAGGPSISPLEGNLEEENMLSLNGDSSSYLAVALLAGPQQAGGSVGADFQDTTPSSSDGPLDLSSTFLDLSFGPCTNYVMADCGAQAANNGMYFAGVLPPGMNGPAIYAKWATRGRPPTNLPTPQNPIWPQGAPPEVNPPVLPSDVPWYKAIPALLMELLDNMNIDIPVMVDPCLMAPSAQCGPYAPPQA